MYKSNLNGGISMSLTIKCGETFGLIEDDLTIRELVMHIATKCVKPGTEYFQVLHCGKCVAEYKKGVVYEQPNITHVHDIKGFHRAPFFIKFACRFADKDKKKKKDFVKPEIQEVKPVVAGEQPVNDVEAEELV